MPRAGGRDFKFVVKTMDQIFQRNLDAWSTDNRTFTHSPAKRASTTTTKKVKITKNTTGTKKVAAKSTKKKSRR